MNDVSPTTIAWASRGYTLHSLRPQAPIFGWLATLDDALAEAPARYGDRLVVLDLTGATLHGPGTRALVQELQSREFRIVGLSGIAPDALGAEAARLPPILAPGVPTGETPALLAAAPAVAASIGKPATPAIESDAGPVLLVRAIRSGQVISNPRGDITIVGSVSSGAELVAAGAIHVYGTLQGRATAGPAGAIFCQRLEAELLRIGDVFLAADDMPASLRGRAVRAWRDGDEIRFAALV